MADPNPPATTSRTGDVVRIIGGLVVVAVVVGIGLWAERMTDDDLELPDEVAGLALDDSAASREFATTNTDGLSEAYDAEAASAVYGSEPRSKVLVSAVRAKAGPPVPTVFTKDHEWVVDDKVHCLVFHQQKGIDSIVCQRGDGDLTVQLLTSTPGELELDGLVDATNDVWEELS